MNPLPAFLLLFLIAFGSSIAFSQEDGPRFPIDISFDPDKLKQLDFGTDSLNADTILFKLFPAPMDEDDPELSEWKTSAYWKCSSCTQHEFVSYEDGEVLEKEILPYDGNYTWCTGILYYQSGKGTLRAIVSFSTSQMNDGTGRFTRGLLSLAHFEKQNGKWELLNFNPFVNFQGSFTLASPIDQAMIGENGKTYFLIHGGEANGVSAEEYWPLYQGLYILDGETLKELFHHNGASCEENGGEPLGSIWKTGVKKITAVSEGVQFTLQTTGLFVKEYDWFRPIMLQSISKEDFDELPSRFEFEAVQLVTKPEKGLKVEKPSVSITYTDEKGMKRTQKVETQNISAE